MQALASNVMDQLWEAKQQRTQRMCNLIFVLVTTDFITSDNISLVVTILRCGHKMAWCFVIIKMTSWQNSDSHQHRCPRSNSSELLLNRCGSNTGGGGCGNTSATADVRNVVIWSGPSPQAITFGERNAAVRTPLLWLIDHINDIANTPKYTFQSIVYKMYYT